MIAGRGTTRPQRSGLTAADIASGDGFGCSAAIAAATAIVSARYCATGMWGVRPRDSNGLALSQNRMFCIPVPVVGVPAIPPGRVVLRIAQVGVQLALQGALEHDLGQPAEQPARPSQRQALGPGPPASCRASSSSAASACRVPEFGHRS